MPKNEIIPPFSFVKPINLINYKFPASYELAERHEGSRVFQRRKSKMLPDFSCEMRRVTSVHENWAFLKAYFAYLKKLPSVGGGNRFMYKAKLGNIVMYSDGTLYP
jgi:hypothetical protein